MVLVMFLLSLNRIRQFERSESLRPLGQPLRAVLHVAATWKNILMLLITVNLQTILNNPNEYSLEEYYIFFHIQSLKTSFLSPSFGSPFTYI